MSLTLACIDCVHPALAAKALATSSREVPWSRIVLFSHDRPSIVRPGMEFQRIRHLATVDEYNLFVLRELWRHIETEHVLTVQTDGYIVNPHLWDPSWLEYDYIGAPWDERFHHARHCRVGNSGCCLRSQALLKRTSELVTDDLIVEHRRVHGRILDDVMTCCDLHGRLASSGLRFAPPDVAARFCFERETPENSDWRQSFAFHGRQTFATRGLCRDLHRLGDVRIEPADERDTWPIWRNVNADWQLPPTGMISPSRQKIIQVDITNACPKRCSNCTRFVMHQRRPFVMDMQTFERAVDSLDGYAGMIGIMGGEPTVHPQFERIVRHFSETVDSGRTYQTGRRPIVDFASHRQQHLASLHHRRGLWTSLGKRYYEHFELIHDVFGYQCINDHSHPGLHQALLVSYRDLGISRDEFELRRDSCWVQRMWSASITPRGAYFCEVAAAIDNLFYSGKNAWPIERDWWKRSPADFGEQLQLCEHCSACLSVPRRRATDEIEDVSESNYAQLVQIGSPAVRKGKVAVFAPDKYDPAEYACEPNPEWYMEQPTGSIDNLARIAPTNRTIYPKQLDGLLVCVDFANTLQKTIAENRRHFDRLAIVTSSHDVRTQAIAKDFDCELVISDRCYDGGEPFNKGRLLNDGMAMLEGADWILNLDADILLPPTLREWVFSRVLNPGCLYYTSRYHAMTDVDLQRTISHWPKILRLQMRDPLADQMPWGYFQLWNPLSVAIRDNATVFSESFPTAGGIDNHFQRQWDAGKRIRIDDYTRELSCVHLWHGPFSEAWHGQRANGNSWELIGQTHATTGRLWKRRPLQLPCEALVIRLDTAERRECVLTDEDVGAMVADNIPFDVYVRRQCT